METEGGSEGFGFETVVDPTEVRGELGVSVCSLTPMGAPLGSTVQRRH